MFDPRDFAADPRTRPEARPRRDHAKERENRERDGHRREYDPRRTKRQNFQDRTDRAIADVGMYRNVAYRDVVDAHFEGHPYTARRAVDQMVRSGHVQEHTAEGPQGGSYKVLTLTERGVERAERSARPPLPSRRELEQSRRCRLKPGCCAGTATPALGLGDERNADVLVRLPLRRRGSELLSPLVLVGQPQPLAAASRSGQDAQAPAAESIPQFQYTVFGLGGPSVCPSARSCELVLPGSGP